MKLIHFGTVNDGKLIMSNRKRFDQDITQFEGKRVEVVIQKAKKHRSNEQNKYYWAVVLPVALKGLEDAGNIGLDIETVHEFFKSRFLQSGKEIIIPMTGESVIVNKTTTVLTTTEMMDYIEQIAQFCAEYLNTVIPEPTPLF